MLTQISKSVIELVGKGTKVGFADVKIVSALTQSVVLNIAVEILKLIHWTDIFIKFSKVMSSLVDLHNSLLCQMGIIH